MGEENTPIVTANYLQLTAPETAQQFLEDQSTLSKLPVRANGANLGFVLADHIAPGRPAGSTDAVLSLDVVRRGFYETEIIQATRVLERLDAKLPAGVSLDFGGSALGTGFGEATGKILVSPRLMDSQVAKNHVSNGFGQRQIFVLYEKLQVEESIPFSVTEELMPITSLSMDSRFIYAFGQTSINGTSLLAIDRQSKKVVLSLVMPASFIDKTHAGYQNQTQINYGIGTQNLVQTFQVSSLSVVDGMVRFSGIIPSGKTESYSFSLPELVEAALYELQASQ
jgi:hypothetical protein